MKTSDFCFKANLAIFNFFRCGLLYYVIKHKDESKGSFQFSIPIEDTGNGTFSAAEKAITLMRWIRKAIDNNELTLIS